MEAFDLDRIGGRRALADLTNEIILAGGHARRMFEAGMIRWEQRERVSMKPDRTPVTEADRLVEERLSGYLRKHFPAAGFLGEETGEHRAVDGESGTPDHGLCWVLDPIDGTRAFVRGIETWSVLLGLLWNGTPVLGLAYMPAADELFSAVAGDGAWGNGRPLRVSPLASFADSTVAHGSLQQFTGTGHTEMLGRLGEQTQSQRGFSDFDGYRRLLRGQVDAMVDPGVAPWDICASYVLVQEAGGKLTSFENRSTIFGGSAVASNGLIHDSLVALIAGT